MTARKKIAKPVQANKVKISFQFVLQQASWYKPQTWGAGAIAWFTQGHFSHVDYMTSCGCLYGARSDKLAGIPSGVQFRPQGYAKFKRQVVYTLEVTERQKFDLETFLFKQHKKPYDKLAILAFVLNRNWHDDSKWICSELGTAAAEQGAIIHKLVYEGVNKVSPVMFAEILEASGATVEVIR